MNTNGHEWAEGVFNHEKHEIHERHEITMAGNSLNHEWTRMDTNGHEGAEGVFNHEKHERHEMTERI